MIFMQPFDQAWMVLKEERIRPSMHRAMGLKNLSDKHKEEMRRFQIQQFADGFSTSHQPSAEERDAALLDFRRKQMQERELAMQGAPMPRMNHPPSIASQGYEGGEQ